VYHTSSNVLALPWDGHSSTPVFTHDVPQPMRGKGDHGVCDFAYMDVFVLLWVSLGMPSNLSVIRPSCPTWPICLDTQ